MILAGINLHSFRLQSCIGFVLPSSDIRRWLWDTNFCRGLNLKALAYLVVFLTPLVVLSCRFIFLFV